MLQRAGSHRLQLLEGIVKAALEVRVGDDQDAFLVPRHQADLLRNTCVQLKEQTKVTDVQNAVNKKKMLIFIASLLETGFQITTLEATNQIKPTYFVETGNNMAEVDPGCSCFRHLVEQVIPEELQQVAVSGLRPCWVLLEPEARNTRLQSQDSKTPLAVPSLQDSQGIQEGRLTPAAR